jgi:RNA polymerase sigma factor (sigma-70 family)
METHQSRIARARSDGLFWERPFDEFIKTCKKNQLSDKDLNEYIELWQQGYDTAHNLEKIIYSVGQHVYSLCSVYTGDYFQSCVMHLIKSVIPTYKPQESSFRTYLHICIERHTWKLFTDQFTQKNKPYTEAERYEARAYSTRHARDPLIAEELIEDTEITPEEQIENDDFTDHLKDLFEDMWQESGFSQRYREIIDRRLDGESYTDIGKTYKISRQCVEQIYNRVIARFRNLDAEGDGTLLKLLSES